MDLFTSAKFDARVEELMRETNVPGFAVAIIHAGRIASKGFGYASYSQRTPCTPDTLFDIASCSKSFTAAALGLLVEDDEKYLHIKYDSKVSKLLPGDFVLAEQSYTDDVSVDDILGHRTGLPSHDHSYLGEYATHPDNARSITRNLRNLPLTAPIRAKHMYNNIMYTVATDIVEEHTGTPFAEHLEDRFFSPLGMNSTHLQISRSREKGLGDRIAKGHSWVEESKSFLEFDTPNDPEANGAGSIMTSANDFILWVKALMNKEAPVTEDVFKGMWKGRSIAAPDFKRWYPFTSPEIYGAGLETFSYRGHDIIGHDSAVPGFCAKFFLMPNSDFGMALIGNETDCNDIISIVLHELVDELLQVPSAERIDWKKHVLEGIFDFDKGNTKEEEEMRQDFCPGIGESQPQTKPLSAYTGTYHNAGYHNVVVSIRDDKLFIDAIDRSASFTLVFSHVCDQTKYIARLHDYLDTTTYPLKAEFEFAESSETEKTPHATRLGIEFEDDLGDYIWFDFNPTAQVPSTITSTPKTLRSLVLRDRSEGCRSEIK